MAANIKYTYSKEQKTTNNSPIISVITICFNAQSSIEKTIQSVIVQNCTQFEYLIIDGNSHDDTKKIIQKYINKIDFFSSQPDRGIYDAMNSGIQNAKGKWLIFLNAGDTFSEPTLLQYIINKYIKCTTADFLYSDVYLIDALNRKSIYKCNHERTIINHQCSIYKKSLHEHYGMYLVAKKVTISDYLFFSLIPISSFKKIDKIIANYDTTGISQGVNTIRQKFTIDFLLGKIGIFSFVLRIFLYNYYAKLKKLWISTLNKLIFK